jgi:acetyl-CoA carboxylase biotin carboxyl carrier protein
MSLTQDEILQVLKLLDHSSFDELDLQIGALKLKARRKGVVTPDAGQPQSLGHPAILEARREDRRVLPKEMEAACPAPAPELQEGLVPIKAPMLGTFYRRPSPREPSFVEVGAFVQATDTVCLLEVMKVFSTVQAGVQGTIEKVCVESGELVEFGQILFWIRPEEGDRRQKRAC